MSRDHLSSDLNFCQGFNHKIVYLLKKNKLKHTLSLKLKHKNCVFLLPSSLGPLQPVCLAALRANSLWRYYGYWKACKPLSLYLQEKEKRVWVNVWGRARSWYGRWPHCKWSEQLHFSTGRPAGHLVLFAANCRPLLNYIIVPINYMRRAFISW